MSSCRDDDANDACCDQKLIEEGSLAALFLTGFGTDMPDVIQAYVDRTADIQTAACVIVTAVENVHKGDLFRAQVQSKDDDTIFRKWCVAFERLIILFSTLLLDTVGSTHIVISLMTGASGRHVPILIIASQK